MASSLGLLFLPSLALAISLPPTPESVTTIPSNLFPGVSISYKQVCETTPNVKAFSGYINLPPNFILGQDYPVHSFFWFFEARSDNPENAPLSLWLQGGPGSPSVAAALGENGPCSVLADSRGTVLNPWSWNNDVNMLYLDQPVQVGFSYDSLINGTINEPRSPFAVTPKSLSPEDLSQDTLTAVPGTFSSQSVASTANTTFIAARASWYFLQTWMQEFPEFQSRDNRLSLWGESYGGHYVPTLAGYIVSQNELIATGNASTAAAIPLQVDVVGLVNACIDNSVQTPLYPVFAYNNTYGLQAINESEYQDALAAVPQCLNLTDTCRRLADELDPDGWGNNKRVNQACEAAYKFCFGPTLQPFNSKGVNLPQHDLFDFTQLAPDSFPPKFAAGYLNSREAQLALGVPLNFTGLSSAVAQVFLETGDFIRGHNLELLGGLLDSGVKVALVYGDRDYQCNWLGGEQIGLAIQSSLSAGFRAAGLSLPVPYYQPETAYRIFSRAMAGADIATGQFLAGANYSTVGPRSSFSIKNTVPQPPEPLCYTWDIMETCTPSQTALLTNGSAIVRDFIMVGYTLPNGTEVIYRSTETSPGCHKLLM
ncbi:carboxypeptidase s1 a [Trichoderma arundinaceum]|uniref:Carboxypeptidase n=1 Tax=Trichoderma arundinaceum TaxID=490622 RepID=A0A395NS53_TRIAR|nr:carboxypeptidase s1 a [Trichoderma arundinaceum]